MFLACRWKNSSVEKRTCGCAGLRGGSVNVGHCMDSDVKLVVRAARPLQLWLVLLFALLVALRIQQKTISLYWVLRLLCMSVRSINRTNSASLSPELPEHSLSLAVRVGFWSSEICTLSFQSAILHFKLTAFTFEWVLCLLLAVYRCSRKPCSIVIGMNCIRAATIDFQYWFNLLSY